MLFGEPRGVFDVFRLGLALFARRAGVVTRGRFFIPATSFLLFRIRASFARVYVLFPVIAANICGSRRLFCCVPASGTFIEVPYGPCVGNATGFIRRLTSIACDTASMFLAVRPMGILLERPKSMSHMRRIRPFESTSTMIFSSCILPCVMPLRPSVFTAERRRCAMFALFTAGCVLMYFRSVIDFDPPALPIIRAVI